MSINIGSTIKEARKKIKMTQKQLAKELNKSERMIQKYENNEVIPSFDIMKQISKILNADIHNPILNDAIKTIDETLSNVDNSIHYQISQRQNSSKKISEYEDKFEANDLYEYIYSTVVSILTLTIDSKTFNYSLEDFNMNEIDEISKFLYDAYQLKVNEILKRHLNSQEKNKDK
ncbi:helix-turn-helix transcriptional regulator [uncultured Clostridium sp.]|uniref:helix-turn-helix transcriptional regulator n=1 Tax=uncultured Clostridium sp. TaxID=59620 RepID=UPI0025FD5A60|nr:helix-turn-helix transcriptional regulator [uncultured Clostridium sp.]